MYKRNEFFKWKDEENGRNKNKPNFETKKKQFFFLEESTVQESWREKNRTWN